MVPFLRRVSEFQHTLAMCVTEYSILKMKLEAHRKCECADSGCASRLFSSSSSSSSFALATLILLRAKFREYENIQPPQRKTATTLKGDVHSLVGHNFHVQNTGYAILLRSKIHLNLVKIMFDIYDLVWQWTLFDFVNYI